MQLELSYTFTRRAIVLQGFNITFREYTQWSLDIYLFRRKITRSLNTRRLRTCVMETIEVHECRVDSVSDYTVRCDGDK